MIGQLRHAVLALLAGLLLTACSAGRTAEPASVATLDVPEILTTCPRGVSAPPAPAPPRTVEQVIDWAKAVDDARARTEKARAECAYRLRRLNVWISANQVVPGDISLTEGQ